jgi:hypothetical protein
VCPCSYNTIDLDIKHVGFVIVQVKNDLNSHRSEADWFKMDPFKCGLLEEFDKDEEGRSLIPIIRIVFTLAVETPTVTHRTHKLPSDGATSLGSDGQPHASEPSTSG